MDIPTFNGGVSYTHAEMTELFKHIIYHKNFSILEFASGNSTVKIYDHFKKHVKNPIFYSYESESRFLKPHTGVNFVHYSEQAINSVEIPNIKFDLILFDGSTSNKKSLLSKIKDNVKDGTILAIDYFNHFECVSDLLDINFEYELLGSNNEPFIAYGEHSWTIVRIKRTM